MAEPIAPAPGKRSTATMDDQTPEAKALQPDASTQPISTQPSGSPAASLEDEPLSPAFVAEARELLEGKRQPKAKSSAFIIERLRLTLAQSQQGQQQLGQLQTQAGQLKVQLDQLQGSINTLSVMLRRSEADA